MRPEGGSAPATSYRRTGTACGLSEGLPRRKVRKSLDATPSPDLAETARGPPAGENASQGASTAIRRGKKAVA